MSNTKNELVMVMCQCGLLSGNTGTALVWTTDTKEGGVPL